MTDAPTRPGPLALVGGGEWHDGCTFDRALLEAADRPEVTILPTAAAYERPERAVARAAEWFEGLGATIRVLPVYGRRDAHVDEHVDAAGAASFLYLCDGSPMHLVSVVKATPLWDAVRAAWRGGAVLAGSGAGGDVLCDPMVDPRGGAFTVGLGLLRAFSIIPRSDTWNPDTVHRTVQLAAPGHVIAAVPQQTALVRSPDGAWRTEGAGEVTVYLDGARADLSALASVALGD